MSNIFRIVVKLMVLLLLVAQGAAFIDFNHPVEWDDDDWMVMYDQQHYGRWNRDENRYKMRFACAYIWGPENLPHLGKYIQKPRNQIKPNDPCSIPGPPGSNYYLQWKHGRVKDYKFTWQWDEEMNCVKKIYYNEDGYYVSHGKKSTKGSPGCYWFNLEGKKPGFYKWNHGKLPKYLTALVEKRIIATRKHKAEEQSKALALKEISASPVQDVTPIRALALKEITASPVQDVTPIRESKWTTVPLPQAPKQLIAATTREPISMNVPSPQGAQTAVAMQASPPLPYGLAPSYYYQPWPMDQPETVNIFL